MGRRIPKPEPVQSPADKAAAASAAQAAQELDTLHPERSLKLRGRLLTLREYAGIEGLHLQGTIAPLLDDLYQLFGKDTGKRPSAVQVRGVFSRHVVAVQWLIAQASVPYPEDPNEQQAFAEEVAAQHKFVGSLNDLELDALLAVWWNAVGGFIRRFRERSLADSQSDSSASTPP